MLPLGEWIRQPKALLGYAGNVYFFPSMYHMNMICWSGHPIWR
ncbi:hypothetical protein ACFTAO_26170 [Paenibacillus rhizoplanae]